MRRSTLVNQLTRRGDADGLLALVRAFDLSSPSEQEIEDWKTVASALASLEPPGSPAADELLATLDERNFPGVLFAGELLADMGDRRAIDPLLRRLRAADPSDCSEESRADWSWLTQALGELRAVEAVDTLIAALPLNVGLMQEDTAIALENIDDPRAIPALIAALKPREGIGFDAARNAILNALDHFGTPEAIQALEADREAFERNLGSVSWLVAYLEAHRANCPNDPRAAFFYADHARWTCERLEEIGTPEAAEAIQSIRAFVEPDWPKRDPYESRPPADT